MPIVTVSGASDDLIEIGRDGKPFEEFYCYNRDGTDVVFSDGTVLRVRFGNDGVWEYDVTTEGTAHVTIRPTHPPGADTAFYSDSADVAGQLTWMEADDGGRGVRRVTL